MSRGETLTERCEWIWANHVINGTISHWEYECVSDDLTFIYDVTADDVYAAMHAASEAVHGPLA